MGWAVGVIVVFSLMQHLTITPAVAFPQDVILKEQVQRSFDNFENDESIENNPDENLKLEILGQFLSNILLQPWPKNASPLLYIEDDGSTPDKEILQEDARDVPYKRSRYYRKYPWKRQNARYDSSTPYLCEPSKDDVFRLLVALHGARQGSRGQLVNFCNRKRPATAVFTNLRFMG